MQPWNYAIGVCSSSQTMPAHIDAHSSAHVRIFFRDPDPPPSPPTRGSGFRSRHPLELSLTAVSCGHRSGRFEVEITPLASCVADLQCPLGVRSSWSDPENLYPPVEIGDVGYISQGQFPRFFNVLLPANHPLHRNFGVPDYHEQLIVNIESRIGIGKLSPHNFCSAGVTTVRAESDRWANG